MAPESEQGAVRDVLVLDPNVKKNAMRHRRQIELAVIGLDWYSIF